MTSDHRGVKIILSFVTGCAMFLTGCSGGGDQGPERYELTGEIKFDGQSVPHGFIMFTPDSTKGNSGPATGAPIVDGAYATPDGKGAVGGPHVVKITGYDGIPIVEEGEELTDGTELFPVFQKAVEIPKESGTLNFDVPKPE